MIKSYCLKERNFTENVNPKIVKTKNNLLMEASKCASCSIKKARFIKNDWINPIFNIWLLIVLVVKRIQNVLDVK